MTGYNPQPPSSTSHRGTFAKQVLSRRGQKWREGEREGGVRGVFQRLVEDGKKKGANNKDVLTDMGLKG